MSPKEFIKGYEDNIDLSEFNNETFDALLNFYQKIFLPGFVCHHTDRASMMNSLEVRSPFLNKRLLNSSSFISALKIEELNSKNITKPVSPRDHS